MLGNVIGNQLTLVSDEILKRYRSRMGIEAMFKNCKIVGYNLEGRQEYG